jgi:hypothetical protein
MRYKQFIQEAWELTQNNKSFIRWYAFLPSTLSLLVGVLYVAYQYYAFKSSQLFEGWEKPFFMQVLDFGLNFVTNESRLALILFFVVLFLLLLHFLLPALCHGALISLIARRYNGHEVRTLEGVRYGLMSFLRLLQFQILSRGLSVVAIAAPAAMIMRAWGKEVVIPVLVVFGIFMVIALIVQLLFTYAEFFIVIDGEDIFPAISKSMSLVVSHWEMTFLIGILMLIIGARIILQIILVMLVPLLVILPASYLATVTFQQVGILIGGVIGLVGLFFAGYLSATVQTFANSVWVITFLELSKDEIASAREKAELEVNPQT